MTYICASDLQSVFFVCGSLRELKLLQSTGKYSLHVWLQVQCKSATAFPQRESRRVEARVGSCGQLRNARRPGQFDRQGIENMLPDDNSGGYWLLSVFESHVWESGKQKAWSDCGGSKDPPNVDDRRLRRTSTTWETSLEAHRSLERKILTKAKALTAISRGKPPNEL